VYNDSSLFRRLEFGFFKKLEAGSQKPEAGSQKPEAFNH